MVQDKLPAMSSLPRQPPSELYCYEPPPSLWALVEAYVPDHELEEIRLVLGESLIEQSLELHQEVGLLLEIWREYREETEDQLMYTRLPEPPAARERLKQEIKFFLENIRDKAKANGRNPEEALSRHNTTVLDYVMDEQRPGSGGFTSRPSTARSGRDGRETPMVLGTPSSLASTVSEEVDSVKDKLNVVKIDEVTQHLRDTLEEEINQLMKDIDFLQRCLDDEADYRGQSGSGGEPTLTDLREERTKLEKTMLSDEPAIPDVLRQGRKSSPTIRKPAPAPVSSEKLRPTPPSSASGAKAKRPQPMKANHHLPASIPPLSLSRENSTDSTDTLISTRSVESRGADMTSVLRHARSGSANSRVDSASSVHSLRRYTAASPSHIAIRVGDQGAPGGGTSKVVKVGSINLPSKEHHTPSPPSAVKPPSGRPNSASRFRKMVINCRDDK